MIDMARVIDGLREAAEELVRYAPMKVNGRCQVYFDMAIHLLKAQEKIVRCKDCKNGAYIVERDRLPFIKCGGVDHELDWFCADGRKVIR